MAADPVWQDVREDWLPNDGYRDVFIPDATDDDWRRIIAWIRSRPWKTTYTEDSELVEMPDVVEIMARHSTVSTLWAVDIGGGVTANGYFREGDTHFDFDPNEIRGPTQFALVCGFVRSLGEVANKRVNVCREGHDEHAVMTFDPATGEFATPGE